MLFNKNQLTDVYYDLATSDYQNHIPKGYFNNVEEYIVDKKIGCPAIPTMNSQLYYVNSPVDITFTINKLNYRFEFDKGLVKNSLNVDIMNELAALAITPTGVYNFQLEIPYVFYTNEPDTHIHLLPPNIYTENVTFVTGSFNINQWLRTVVPAFVINNPDKKAVIKFEKDKPLYYLMFNKNCNLNYKKMNEQTYDYFRNIRGLSN
jgi:hypothetical protein